MTSDRPTRASFFSMGSTRRGTPADAYPARGFREKSLVLDAAVDEYLRLQREGKTVSKEEFCARYPDYRHSLRRMIDVEEALPAFEQLEKDFWPQVGGCFLGYDILDLLGAGSIARVFLAAEIQLGGRAVAIKVSRHGGYEAETLGKLRHPNIVEVYSVNHDVESGLTVVCMPYQGSATLSDLLDAVYREQKPHLRAKVISDVGRQMALPAASSEEDLSGVASIQKTLEHGTFVDGVVHLGMQLASALHYAHQHGVLHRDLKPSNILLTPTGRPMLLDFNLSFDAALNMVHRGGTLPYSAPEQLREATQVGPMTRSVVDARADLFSLGAILYELLTGRLPYGAPPSDIGPRQAIQWQLEAQRTPPPSIRQWNSQVDSQLESMILRCLSPDPAKRFANMTEFESALERHFRLRWRVTRWIQQHRRIAAAIAVGGCLFLGAGALLVASIPPYFKREQVRGAEDAEMGNQPDALVHFTNALKANPNDGETYFLRGVSFQQSNDDESAIADFEAALKCGYDTEALWIYWGYSLYKAPKTEKLLSHYATACKKYPHSSDLQLSHIYARHARFQRSPDVSREVLSDLDGFIRKNPDRFEGYLFRATIRYRLNRAENVSFDQAVSDIQAACDRCNSIAVVEFEAAKILASVAKNNLALGEKARTHLRKAVELGYSRRSIETLVEFTQWNNETWFKDELLSQCQSPEGNPEPSLPTLAFRPSQPRPAQPQLNP